ncbi:MAG TPA: serine/threonine-protein kinase, partial [Gemmatimonadales bacterium]|nr:serine/threonine-protein kinase [Gemmatimonadales bacterium]
MDDPFVERLRRALAPDFEVERVLGAGGMGIVLLAREISLGRRVAIKTIKPEFATAVAVERFLREAQTLASLSHPNIVPIYSLQQRDGIPCIVMEYLEGETLFSRIERGPIPPGEARRILRDVLAALDAAHARGVVHRDVKPANIFLRPDRAVLTDFGIAKPVVSGVAMGEILTVEGQAVGTPYYMAPERFASGDAQPASDIYAVGMVLYEALTGRHWAQEIVDPAAGDWSGVPRDLVPPLQRALAFAPSARWADAATFRRALKARRGAPALLWGSAVAAVGIAAIAIALLWPRPVVADVVIGQFRGTPPILVGQLRQVAYDVLGNAEGLTLAPLRDDVGQVPSAAPGGKYEVSGVVERANGTIHVALQVGGHLREVVSAPGELKEWELGRRIALAILEVVKPEAFEAWAEPCKPRSVEAFNAWYNGQVAFRRDDWGTAIRSFEEALARDPDYCLAAVRLWLAERWSRTPTTVDLADLLARHGGSLAKPDSLMIAAELAQTREGRYALYADAVARDRFGAVVPLQYGSDLFHRGPLDGIPLDSGVTLLRQAREREPRLASIHDQLVWALIRLGEQDSARAALDVLVANAWDSAGRDVDPGVFRLVWAMRFWPMDSVLPLLRGVGQGAGAQVAERLRLGLSFDVASYQVLLGAELAGRPDASVDVRAHGRIAAGVALMALGRTAAGLAQLDSAAAMATPYRDLLALQAAQWRVLAGSLGIAGASDTGRAAADARATLE